MPVPMPHDGEKEDQFMSRCMSKMADEDPSMDNKQMVAICFDSFRKGKKKGESMEEKKVKRDEDGHIIIAENVKIVFGGNIDFTE